MEIGATKLVNDIKADKKIDVADRSKLQELTKEILKDGKVDKKEAEALKKFGLKLDIIPKKFVAESLIEEFSKFNMKNQKVLLARSNLARDVLANSLKEMGAKVNDVVVYKTEKANTDIKEIIKLFEEKKIHYITFTSSSTVKNFVEMLEGHDLSKLLKKVNITSIGPITSETAKELIGRVDIQADEYTIDGVVEAILNNLN